jgi:hypothetical protein
MQSNGQPAPASNKALWIGRIMSAIVVLMLLMSGIMKLMKPAAVVEGFASLGWPEQYAFGLGILELACAAVYMIPRMSIFGAILVTGYFGGAIATHVRLGDPSFIGAAILGVLGWLGLYLREPRLRALIPLRS